MEKDFRPVKQMMKEDFNIEENQVYKILFVSDLLGDMKKIKGSILYFNTSQMCVKTEEGLYIIERENIKEMMPIITTQNGVSGAVPSLPIKKQDIIDYYSDSKEYKQGDKVIIDGKECMITYSMHNVLDYIVSGDNTMTSHRIFKSR